jgi:long-chain fatty acid transport protein
LIASSAHAGGLYLNEFMTPAQGAAGAGAGALAEDASTIIHNPAGLAFVDGESLSVGAGFVLSSIEFDSDFDNPFSDGGDAGGIGPIASAFYSRPVTDDVTLGFGLYSLSAAILDYDDNWIGRSQAQEVTLFTLTGGPSIGYKVNERFSVGASVAATAGYLDFTAAPLGRQFTLDGTDVAFVWGAGALVKITEQTRVGLNYFSGADLNFDGDLVGNAEGISTTTELELPQTVRLDLVHELDDKWTALATIGWDDWKLFVSTSDGGKGLVKNWDDTYHFAIGTRYELATDWQLQGGVAYDTSPVGSGDRTADMPIDRQWRYALGATYKWSESLSVSGSLVYADYGDARINQISPVGGSGEYKSNDLLFLGVNLVWNPDQNRLEVE